MSYSYTYDCMNRLIAKNASGRTLISYDYDKNGNIIKEVDVVGNIKETTYDDIDNVMQIHYNGKCEVDFEYYNNGLKKSMRNGEIRQTYEYDTDYNLTSLQVKNGAQVLADNAYAYDKNGNRTKKSTLNGVTSYDYNSVGQLKSVSYPTYSEELFYDKRGNRSKRIIKDVEEIYSYDQRNRLTNLTKDGQTVHYEYDNAGNLTKDDKAKYFYNEFNQTTKVETFDGNIQVNSYDPEGLRYEMEENDKLVQFIFNHNREVIAEKDESTWRSYIRESELLFSSAEHARTYYHYASDEMGSITHITDGDRVLNTYEYDAWGNVVSEREEVSNRFKFNGQQLDHITGQYYLRARFYNPVIARFTQEDTYRGDGLNLYAYCRNNPVYYMDPTGHLCEAGASRVLDAVNSRTANKKDFKDLSSYVREKVRNGEALTGAEADFYNKITPESSRRAYEGVGNPDAGPYAHLQDSKSVGTGKDFTAAQKRNIIQENMKNNGGLVKSDLSGEVLVKPSKSQRGVTPPQNEWQIDHIYPRDKGGSNSYSNAQVLSRKENRKKWNR